MPATLPQHRGQKASGRHSAQQQRRESHPPTLVTAPPSPTLQQHCENLRCTVRTCSALLPPLCCLLCVPPLLQAPRMAWARPSGAARTLTRSRPPPAGPSERRHVKCRGRYPLQEPPCRPLELPGRRRDLREIRTSPRTIITPSAMLFSAPQYTFYSSHPLRTPDSGRRRLL